MQLIDGKLISAKIKEELKEEVKSIVSEGKRPPHLAVIIVGENPASQVYVNNKIKSCQEIGFESTHIHFPEEISEQEMLKEVEKLNQMETLDGFIVQLPLPKHINEQKIIEAIDPSKDVDGFTPINIGKMTIGIEDAYLPATPMGIMELLNRYKIETEGKNIVVLGRSNIVGRPISILLSQKRYPGNATVTVCHSKTPNLAQICKQADILIAAIGSPFFVTKEMVKNNAVIIDVGTTRIEDSSSKTGYRLAGDVDFENVKDQCSFITPVPGGVGPMTIASLLLNTMKAYKIRIK